jgi:hypothetical protein
MLTFVSNFLSAVRQAHAATNQQLPRVPCEKSSKLAPSTKNLGSPEISWKIKSHNYYDKPNHKYKYNVVKSRQSLH